MVGGYYINHGVEELKEYGLALTGKPGLIISGTSIDDVFSFREEIKKAIQNANPTLEEVHTISIKTNKAGLGEKFERITFVAGGKAQEDQHFYIVQALKKIHQKT